MADTLSRLIEMDEDIKPTPEEDGKEFGYFPFEELPPATTQVVKEVIECECETNNTNIQHIDPDHESNGNRLTDASRKINSTTESGSDN